MPGRSVCECVWVCVLMESWRIVRWGPQRKAAVNQGWLPVAVTRSFTLLAASCLLAEMWTAYFFVLLFCAFDKGQIQALLAQFSTFSHLCSPLKYLFFHDFFFLYHQLLMLHDVSNYCKNLVTFSLISTLFSESWSRSKCVEMCDDRNTSCHGTWIKSQPVLVPRTLNTKAFLCSLVFSPVVKSILWSICILNLLQYRSLISIRLERVKSKDEAWFHINFLLFSWIYFIIAWRIPRISTVC